MTERKDGRHRHETEDLPEKLVYLIEARRKQRVEEAEVVLSELKSKEDIHRKQHEIKHIAEMQPEELLPELLNNFDNKLPGRLARDMAEGLKDLKPEYYERMQELFGTLDQEITLLTNDDLLLLDRITKRDPSVDPKEQHRILGALFLKMIEAGFTVPELRT
ncbi:MAG: hypothetical protein WC817_05065 [Patescibacteria group bacterium]|jgi:ribosomal protein L20A (L18A)